MITWNISQLDRQTSDGFVTTAQSLLTGMNGYFAKAQVYPHWSMTMRRCGKLGRQLKNLELRTYKHDPSTKRDIFNRRRVLA